ncbi:hypothetical protein U1Q18_033789 [Sarracenia purpurea var. burkii]
MFLLLALGVRGDPFKSDIYGLPKGLDHALITGGDVAPLGPQAVTKIHQLFDWAKKSKKGVSQARSDAL